MLLENYNIDDNCDDYDTYDSDDDDDSDDGAGADLAGVGVLGFADPLRSDLQHFVQLDFTEETPFAQSPCTWG